MEWHDYRRCRTPIDGGADDPIGSVKVFGDYFRLAAFATHAWQMNNETKTQIKMLPELIVRASSEDVVKFTCPNRGGKLIINFTSGGKKAFTVTRRERGQSRMALSEGRFFRVNLGERLHKNS